jgi:hypothetical protein
VIGFFIKNPKKAWVFVFFARYKNLKNPPKIVRKTLLRNKKAVSKAKKE